MRPSPLSSPFAILLALVGIGGCDDVEPLAPRPELQPFAGEWRAESVVVTYDEADLAPFELIASGGSFFLSVRPSGLFTASASFRGSAATRLGQLRLDGDSLLFDIDVPAPATEAVRFHRNADTLHLTGRPFLVRGIRKKLPVEGAMEMKLVRPDP